MKNILGLFIVSCILISCDSGDIIVTSFELEDSKLSLCGSDDQKVLYVINNDNVYETMSLEVTGNQFEDSLQNVLTTNVDKDIVLNFNNNNRLTYRLYDGDVPSDYFCSQIPPKEPRVIDEYQSTSGGTININTFFNDNLASDDADGDGLDNSEEGWNAAGVNQLDTDGDGIPNYLDIDDDGDNVSTKNELTTTDEDPTAEGLKDTDEDGIPNYLDPDDDNDGALTRLEVSSTILNNPTAFAEADGIPNYLNNQINTTQPEHNQYISHRINRSYRSTITLSDFKLVKQDGSGEEIRFSDYNMGYFESSSVGFSQTPQQADSSN